MSVGCKLRCWRPFLYASREADAVIDPLQDLRVLLLQGGQGVRGRLLVRVGLVSGLVLMADHTGAAALALMMHVMGMGMDRESAKKGSPSQSV